MKLHLTHENQFIPYVIQLACELNLDDHRFVLMPHGGGTKSPDQRNVFHIPYPSAEFEKVIGDLDQYSTVYLHWLLGPTADFACCASDSLKLVWCFWGGDGLGLPPHSRWLLGPATYEWERNAQRVRLKSLFTITGLQDRWAKRKQRIHQLEAIRRVDYFAHYIPEDFETVKRETGLKGQFVPFHYAAAETVVESCPRPQHQGFGNIWLGNSDTPSNNHIEAIDLLASVGWNKSKVICPLSYVGGDYSRYIEEYGRRKLGDVFVPLLKLMKRDEYQALLSTSSASIMNHIRSQGLGNIMVLLWSGSRLLMNAGSSLFRFLRDHGFVVESLESAVKEKGIEAFLSLSIEEQDRNRERLLAVFGRESHLKKMECFFNL